MVTDDVTLCVSFLLQAQKLKTNSTVDGVLCVVSCVNCVMLKL